MKRRKRLWKFKGMATGAGSYPPHFFMFHLSNCYDHLCNTDSIIFAALESSCVCWRENHTTGSQGLEAMKSQGQWISSGRHLNGDPYCSYHSDHSLSLTPHCHYEGHCYEAQQMNHRGCSIFHHSLWALHLSATIRHDFLRTFHLAPII